MGIAACIVNSEGASHLTQVEILRIYLGRAEAVIYESREDMEAIRMLFEHNLKLREEKKKGGTLLLFYVSWLWRDRALMLAEQYPAIKFVVYTTGEVRLPVFIQRGELTTDLIKRLAIA